jgi:hypothetical protein
VAGRHRSTNDDKLRFENESVHRIANVVSSKWHFLLSSRQTLVVTFETRLPFCCRVDKEETSVWVCPKVQEKRIHWWHSSLGKERITIRSADWQKEISGGSLLPNVDHGWYCPWEQDRFLRAFKKQTVSSRNIFRAKSSSSKDTYGTWKVLRIIYGALRVHATISMCLTNWSGWSFPLKFFRRASQPHWFLNCAGRDNRYTVTPYPSLGKGSILWPRLRSWPHLPPRAQAHRHSSRVDVVGLHHKFLSVIV